jgi:hypothetical protein
MSTMKCSYLPSKMKLTNFGDILKIGKRFLSGVKGLLSTSGVQILEFMCPKLPDLEQRNAHNATKSNFLDLHSRKVLHTKGHYTIFVVAEKRTS